MLLFIEKLQKIRFTVDRNQINTWSKKISDLGIGKKNYQSLIRKKNTKSVKQSWIITYQQKTFKYSSNVDIKLIITEHPKTSHKLSKTIYKVTWKSGF